MGPNMNSANNNKKDNKQSGERDSFIKTENGINDPSISKADRDQKDAGIVKFPTEE